MAKTKVKLQFLQNYLDYPERYMLIFEHAWKLNEFNKNRVGKGA